MLSKLAKSFSANARMARGRVFRDSLSPTENDTILDLGGGTGEHISSLIPFRDNVTIADLSENDLEVAAKKFGFRTFRFDGSDELPFSDREFDILFCSSVIEHVTGPKETVARLNSGKEFHELAQTHQRKFANEIRRICSSYFVQTPYRYFPIESHTWFPVVFVFLPRKLQRHIIRAFNKFWPKRTQPDWHLLTVKEMKNLFPDAEIVREKKFGMTKSLIALRKKKTSSSD